MRLWQVGCGAMGGAMLHRWIASGQLDPADVTVILRPGSTTRVPQGVATAAALPAGPLPDAVLLAMKPQQIDAVAPLFEQGGRLPLLVSILAGVDEAALAARFDAASIVRAMPNLPVRIGRGLVALTSDRAGPDERSIVSEWMAPLGLVEWIEDAAFDLVTALAGSGPAFLYRFIDALSAAGGALGLPSDMAARLALHTVEGAARMAAAMARDDGVDPAALADRVASKGGSTRAGLDVLDADDALVALLTQTLAAARDRNAAMGRLARK